jgi:hypothetical protein
MLKIVRVEPQCQHASLQCPVPDVPDDVGRRCPSDKRVVLVSTVLHANPGEPHVQRDLNL